MTEEITMAKDVSTIAKELVDISNYLAKINKRLDKYADSPSSAGAELGQAVKHMNNLVAELKEISFILRRGY